MQGLLIAVVDSLYCNRSHFAHGPSRTRTGCRRVGTSIAVTHTLAQLLQLRLNNSRIGCIGLLL
jgi:hypothetical protein